MSKLIAIDNGHGLNTAGKRTPLFPDGSFMHEWEFNHAVAKYLEAELQRCGFKTLMLSDTEEDTPLQRRTDRCNKANADFCVSIHYNAMGNIWQTTATGTETYSYLGNTNDAKYANTIHPYLVQATGLKDRGYKQADFHMVREPKCPAILIEFGFMDNHIDADLALQHSFRKRCSVGLAKGICTAFGVEYVAEVEKEVVGTKRYKNISEMPEFYQGYIKKWVDEGIIKGNTDGTLDFTEDMLRCLIISERMQGK